MKISESIRNNPEEWTIDRYHFRHKDGVVIWIANGFNHFQLESGGDFTRAERRKVYKAYRWWMANAPMEILGS